MPANGKKFHGVPSNAATLNTYAGTPILCPEGVLLGTDLRTGAVLYFDPWLLKALKIIHSTVCLFTGQKDFGKSTGIKALIIRLLARQAGVVDGVPLEPSAHIHDRKDGEYRLLTEALASTVISLHNARFNPFAPDLQMDELQSVDAGVSLAETVLKRPLREYEPLAIQVGIHRMLTSAGRQLASPDMIEVYLRGQEYKEAIAYFDRNDLQILDSLRQKNVDEDSLNHLKLVMERPARIDPTEFERDSAMVATAFSQLVRGNFGGIFGNERSPLEALTQQVATIDWSGITNPLAAETFEAMMWFWQANEMADIISRRALDPKLSNISLRLTPTLNVSDEEQSAQTPVRLRNRAKKVAMARSFPSFDIVSTQYRQGVLNAGKEGSEERKLAEIIMKGIAIHFIGRIEADDNDALEDLVSAGLSEQDAYVATQLNIGQFGIKVANQPVVWAQIVINDTIKSVAETNQVESGMMESVPISPEMRMTPEDIRRQREQFGAKTIGIEP
jgi:hypothetical protein